MPIDVPRCSIRGGSGLGDSLYVQSIARHLVEIGYRPEVCSGWPDVFRPLWGKIDLSGFRRTNIHRLAHYSLRKNAETDQFRDCCIQAGFEHSIDLRLDWEITNQRLVDQVMDAAKGRPIIAVQLPRRPMDRTDGYGKELLPDCRRINRAIEIIGKLALVVQIGAGQSLFTFDGIELDLANKTTVAELIDVASIANGFLGFVSFVVPLAESFSRPALFVWSRRGLGSHTHYIRQITPAKILHRKSSRSVIDDCTDDELTEAVNALLDEAGRGAMVRGKVSRDSRERAVCNA